MGVCREGRGGADSIEVNKLKGYCVKGMCVCGEREKKLKKISRSGVKKQSAG